MTRSRRFSALATFLLVATLPAFSAPPAATLKQAFADAFLLGTAVNDAIVSGRDGRADGYPVGGFNR